MSFFNHLAVAHHDIKIDFKTKNTVTALKAKRFKTNEIVGFFGYIEKCLH